MALPLLLGILGYLSVGENISDALYYSINLYGMGFEKPEAFVLMLEIARWMAPLMVATSLFLFAQMILNLFKVWIHSFKSDSGVVYGDSEYAAVLAENEKSVMFSEKLPLPRTKNHFVMFASDRDGFAFCRKNMSRMRNKNVFLCTQETENAMLKPEASIRFFSPNDVIARQFWKERQLWGTERRKLRIAVIGFGNLGKRMLEKALQLNLYSQEQSISYFVFGEEKRFAWMHSDMDLMNDDSIHYYKYDGKMQWKLLNTMDMVIVTEKAEMSLIQSIAGCTRADCQIYYFNPEADDAARYLDVNRLIPFGESSKVFTVENIKTDKLYENAIQLNDYYRKLYGGPEWKELSGFLKESNISAADYGEIIFALSEMNHTDRELAQLEHVRWSRFHYLHYWKCAEPGMSKDPQNRLHPCLMRFEKLPLSEQQKDLEQVQMWKTIFRENKS